MFKLALSAIVLTLAAPLSLAADPVNDKCPVMGGDVDKDSPTVAYRGREIGFCCPGCEPKWDAKPEAEKLAFLVKYVPDAGKEQPHVPAPVAAPATPPTRTARAYLDACDKADAKALDALFLDKGRATIFENASDEGAWETYRDHHLMPELAEMKGFAFTLATEKEQAFGTTSIVAQTGSFLIPDPNQPGAPRKIFAAVTYMIVEENGSPKIAHLHWSSRAEKKPAATTAEPAAKPAHGAEGHSHK